ncbi:MAG: Mur ligase family protein [Aminipila sp.]
MTNKIQMLKEYIDLLEEKGLLAETNAYDLDMEQPVRYISYNSRDVRVGTLFICKGAHFSIEYLQNAVMEGAFAYISERKYDLDDNNNIPYIIVKDIRKTMAYISNLYYNQVWENLELIGITGTKGKSTTTYFMKSILDDYLKSIKSPKSAVLSGIDNYDGVCSEESHLTTPETLELHKHFYNAVKSEIEYLTMEVSSQALKYHRTLGVNYSVGCFLNIGEDHISEAEHSDFEDYFKSKLKLFEQCDIACINMDSEHFEQINSAASNCRRIITFGLNENADIYAYNISATGRGISFSVRCDSFDREFKISMPGIFNVSNALAAIAISYALNIPLYNIYSGLKKAQVSGRMEVYTSKSKELYVIVDYAHNKMSFESLFASMKRDFPEKKISIVFGCPGKKALARRGELGELAGRYSDYVFITEEDAGEESLMKICEEIASYVEKYRCEYSIIPDRKEAIRQAINNADRDTVVLVTGKGRETRQKRGTKYIDTPSDVEIVQEFLKDR